MTISAAQSKAARALLDWSQTDLATACGLGESTVRDFEKGRRNPSVDTLEQIRRTFENNGVLFVENGRNSDDGGEGVRFLRQNTEEYDDINLKVLAETLNELRSAIVWFEQKVRDDMRGTKELGMLVSSTVSYRFQDVYRNVKREYEEAYRRVHGIEPPPRGDDEIPF